MGNSVSAYRAENCAHCTGQAVYIFKGNDCFVLRLVGQERVCYKIVQAADMVTTGNVQHIYTVNINPLTPNDPYRDRPATLTSKVTFYIFIEQI